MIDDINIQKIWWDDELAQLRVVCSSRIITAIANIYVTDDLIDDLICQIKRFVNGELAESYWANEEKGDRSTSCVSFRFLHKDKLGHALIEVYMELDDGGSYYSHNCCFYINTEMGLLAEFCEKLPHLKQKTSEIKVFLNNNI